MKMNGFLKALLRAPAWPWMLERRLLVPLPRLVGEPSPSRILEIGCGRGDSTRTIARSFPGARVTAVDVDPDQVREARGRGIAAELEVAAAERLPFPDAAFDAVLEIDTFHHVDDLPRALAEVARVLRPGGRFIAVDVLRHFFVWPVRSIDRPTVMFDANEFDAACADVGLVPAEDATSGVILRRSYVRGA